MENNKNYNELEVLRSQMENFKAQLNAYIKKSIRF